FEARKADILAMSNHIQQANIPVEPPFELKQRIIKMLIDEIVLDVAGDTMEVKGVLRGKFSFENTPVRVAIMEIRRTRVAARPL
ncbi:MAG: hypothetical protein AAF787_24745, partial [Chloroflexota bacterium]